MNLQEEISRIKQVMGIDESVENKSLENYYNLLDSIPTENIKKIALIFPGPNNLEQSLVSVAEKFGVIPGWFRNLDEALNFVNNLVNKGVKAQELVIGSHGDGVNILMTADGEYDIGFLENLVPLVTPNTIVFFTACYGADYLGNLKDAAEMLGVGVYGSAGVYNPVLNKAEKGFYYCSAKTRTEGKWYDNQDLINYGHCKKVDRSPITWVDPFLEFTIRVTNNIITNVSKANWEIIKRINPITGPSTIASDLKKLWNSIF